MDFAKPCRSRSASEGKWTSKDAQENFEKMEALQLQYESEGKLYTKVEIFAEIGGGQIEIEEMRVRQMEYEAILVKRSEMEQTMREHQQIMESSNEERRRASEHDTGSRKWNLAEQEEWRMQLMEQ
ncbi:hypothetical protein CJ030_MR0G013387 [Morella rubra]|uniref:Uncharacterized protein n=1 Tax=Morella rubra TaxID=262757 RepID=A0A6A1UKY3_9ROSI|nr:hypothetical protein CJ030_MR0G013387 [Morella rubra]